MLTIWFLVIETWDNGASVLDIKLGKILPLGKKKYVIVCGNPPESLFFKVHPAASKSSMLWRVMISRNLLTRKCIPARHNQRNLFIPVRHIEFITKDKLPSADVARG